MVQDFSVEEQDENTIKYTILKIYKNYQTYSCNARKFLIQVIIKDTQNYIDSFKLV